MRASCGSRARPRESHVHDVIITKEAPNYRVSSGVVVQTIVFRGLQTAMRRALLTWRACHGSDPPSADMNCGSVE